MPPARGPLFVGRSTELAGLQSELAHVAGEGGARVCVIEGPTGIGKRTLAREVVAQARAHRHNLGAAFSTAQPCVGPPHEVFDGLVDVVMARLDRACQAGRFPVPADTALLLPLLPALGRIALLRSAPEPEDTPSDPFDRRTRAYGAWRELMAIAQGQDPYVAVFEDAHLLDEDARALLRAIVTPPSPAILVLLTTTDARAALGSSADDWPCPLSTFALRELDPAAGRELERHARDTSGGVGHLADLAVGGRLVAVRGASAAAEVEDSIRRALDRLSPPTRLVLELVATAGRPISSRALTLSGALPPREVGAGLTALRERKLVFAEVRHGVERVVCAYDCVRKTTYDALPSDARRARHEAVATALIGDESGDLESIARHESAAGAIESAVERWRRASAVAARKFAFHRSAALLRRVLEHGSYQLPDRRRPILLELASALVGIGRGREAADAYLAAIPGANAAQRIDYERRAATLLLRSGHVDEGIQALDRMLATAGVAIPTGRTAMLLSAGWGRVNVRARGYGFKRRDESRVPQRSLMLLDALGATLQMSAFLSSVAGVGVQTRHLREALAAGEPRRVAAALLTEIGYLAIQGTTQTTQTDRAIAAARKVVKEIGDPALMARLSGITAVALYNQGQFREALGAIEAATRQIRIYNAEDTYRNDIALLDMFRLYSLGWLGRFDELGRQRSALVSEARSRGDLWAASLTDLAAGEYVRLWIDDVARFNAAQDAAIEPWQRLPFGFPHFLHLTSCGNRALTEERGADAVALLERARPKVRHAMLLGSQMLRSVNAYMWGRALLSRGDRADERRILRIASQLTSERVAYAIGSGHLLRAMVAFRGGARARSLQELDTVESILVKMSAVGAMAVVRTLRARVLGGDEGAKLRAENATELRRVGILRPELIFPVLGLRREEQ